VEVQSGFWVAFALGRALHSALVLVLLRIETNVLCDSFLKSIEAAEASTADCYPVLLFLKRNDAIP